MNDDKKYLTELGHKDCERIGEGQESTVYDIGDGKVLKFLKKADLEQVRREKQLYEMLSEQTLLFSLPFIISVGEVLDRNYLVEKKLEGSPLDTILKNETDQGLRSSLLRQYIEAVHALGSITFPEKPFSYLMTKDSVQLETWPELFLLRVKEVFVKNEPYITEVVEDFNVFKEAYLSRVQSIFDDQAVEHSLVHGDYWPPNVLVENDMVSAVMDFGGSTKESCVGDARLDVAGAISFATDHVSPKELSDMRDWTQELYGRDVDEYIELYTMYYALQFLSAKEIDRKAYVWAVSVIKKAV